MKWFLIISLLAIPVAIREIWLRYLAVMALKLNEIYSNLETVTGKTITVTGNYGTASDNPSIATAKGWTVTG